LRILANRMRRILQRAVDLGAGEARINQRGEPENSNQLG
jgi:hypothetical protein